VVSVLITCSTDRFKRTTMDNSFRSSDEPTLFFSTAAVAIRVLLGPVPLVPAHLLDSILGSAAEIPHRYQFVLISSDELYMMQIKSVTVHRIAVITSIQAPFQPSQWTRKPPSRHPVSWGTTWWESPAVLQPETSVSGPFLRIRS